MRSCVPAVLAMVGCCCGSTSAFGPNVWLPSVHGARLPLAGGRRLSAGYVKARERRHVRNSKSTSLMMIDHTSSFMQLASASNLVLAPEILGEVSWRSS